MHPVRLQETAGYADAGSAKKAARGSPPRSLLSPSRRPATAALDARPFSQLVSSPQPATPAPPAPVALPIPLLPFHRAFQHDGWRIALNTNEDRWSGRHVVTSLYALLWLKSEQHILNYSSDRHWAQKVRHMMQMRNAASLAGPNSRATSAALPSFSEEAEFSLAHALHLPHTVIYTQDRAERPHHERLHLSSLPTHVWQRDLSSPECDPADPTMAPFRDCAILPSVWYFSRHAVQGQNEILRKNKPQNKQEHLDMLRKVFLQERSTARPGTTKPNSRPSTAASTEHKEQLTGRFVSLTRPAKVEPPAPLAHGLGKWADISPSQLAAEARAGLGSGQALLANKVDVVAQYMSLDRKRGTHVAFLQRRDMEQFIEHSASPAPADGPSSSPPPSRPSTGVLTDQQRKDRLRQSLYSNLYNDMDIIAPNPESNQIIAAVGTKPRPSTSPSGFDPLALHASSPPTRGSFAHRKIVAMLQQYVQPPGDHAEVLRVEWREELVTEFAAKAREARARRKEVRTLERKLQARRDRRARRNILLETSDIEEEDEGEDEEEEEQEARLERASSEATLARQELQDMDQKRTVCYISRRLNANPLRADLSLGARDPRLYDRVCCFGYSDSSPPVIDSTVMNGVLYTRLSYVCDILSQHVSSISSGNLQPHAMTLFFQIDANHDLHLLWSDRLVYWHEKALLEGPERPVGDAANQEEKDQTLVEEEDEHPIDWSEFDFEHFPAPSANSALMSEALQGRYHQLVGSQVAALNTQSLKDDPEPDEDTADEQPAPEEAEHEPTPRIVLQVSQPTTEPAPRHLFHSDSSSSDDDDEEPQPTESDAPAVSTPTVVVDPLSDSDILPEHPDGPLAALLSNSKVESKSEWADEILFEFARKRQAERNHFRRQQDAYDEDQVKKRAMFVRSNQAPSPTAAAGPRPGTAAARAAAVAPPSRGKQGVNLLAVGAGGGAGTTTLLNTGGRREISSPAAFLLASQQKMYGGTAIVPGARSLRSQLAPGTELVPKQLLPSSLRSGWEGRGVGGARRDRQLAKEEEEETKAAQPNRASPMGKHKPTDFQARVREQFEANTNSKPLRASASLSALGVAVTSSNLRTMAHSASSTSFAPPKVDPLDDADADDEEDTTFMTAAPLSPRSLTAQARTPGPLNLTRSTHVTLSGVPQAATTPSNYFTCPKCRLNLQIHSVHSTMVVDILGEYGRMCQFLKANQQQFDGEIAWNFRRGNKKQHEVMSSFGSRPSSSKPKTRLPPTAVLEDYLDIKYYKEDAIPPTIAFVFPHMTFEAYLHYREDVSFLRSTIDLCSDCHLLVRVPLMPGTEEEVQNVEPLRLIDGAGTFFNPDTESLKLGQGHSSIMSRQSHRALDQEVEERSFAAEMASHAQARRDRAPGEVDPHSAAAGLIPLDIRRLNQSTVELLSHIPYNELEVAEFERKRAEQEAAAEAAAHGRADGSKAAHVASVLAKYKRNKREHGDLMAASAEQNGHITANTPMTEARRSTQQQLLAAAGVAPDHTPRSSHQARGPRRASVLLTARNPFMHPRDSPDKLSSQVPSALARHRAQTSRAHVDDSKETLRPSQGMSRYDPDLVSSMGGVVVSPAADAALVQSERRRAQTEDIITSIVSSSAAVRAQYNADAKAGKLSSAQSGVTFAPLFAQLTAPMRLARPVDHVALTMEANSATRREFRAGGKQATHTRAASLARTAVVSPAPAVLKVHATTAGLSMSTEHEALRDLPTAYAVTTPSKFTPNLITVAHNRGHIQPLSSISAPTM